VIPLFKVAMSQHALALASQTLASGFIGQGPRVDAFETAFGQLVDAPVPPLALNSCTSAIELALTLIGVKPGDEVISTPMTCVATNAPILRTGAKIIWADVDPLTGLIDPDDVRPLVWKKTKAIVAVDYGGRVCDYDALKKYGVPVIEDAAHALLSTRRRKPIARCGGDYICWSFQAIKHLTTVDGGALLPPADHLERGRLLRWYGLDRRSNVSFRAGQDIPEIGSKWHMNDVNAAIGVGNLPDVQAHVQRHRDNAAFYAGALSAEVPRPAHDPESAAWLYTVLPDQAQDFTAHMQAAGVEVGPAHARNDFQTAFRPFRGRQLPGVTAFHNRQINIPVGWWVTDRDRALISDAVNASVHAGLWA